MATNIPNTNPAVNTPVVASSRPEAKTERQELPAHGNTLPSQTKSQVPEKVDSDARQPSAEAKEAENRTTPTRAEVERAVNEVKGYALQVQRRELQFRIDQATGETTVTIRDSESQEVIRQIPSEEMLAMAERLKQQAQGGGGGEDKQGGLGFLLQDQA